ncbi:hypothetical protein, partial [Citrobacter amalonaticus]|uniref:hypothetical protein n=1 Tax=Citrobacter amalonaticus TaxID=35703 RepID=UPI001E39BB41
RGIFWLCHKKLHLTQLSVQLLGGSPSALPGLFRLEIIFKANATTITIIRIVAVHVIAFAIQN